MNPAGGYIRLYRRVWDHPAFRDRREASLFCWMLTTAQWQANRISTKYGPVSLEPGELIVAERELAEGWSLHRNTLRSLLHRMIEEGLIERILDRAPHRAGTVVRILKYQEYQNVEGGEGATKDRKRTADEIGVGPKRDRSGTKNNEGNEENEGNELNRLPPERAAAAAARKARDVVVPEWLPADAWAALCRYRRGKTWTVDAQLLSIRELGKLREEGNDPTAVIEQTIRNSWRGLFPLKTGQAGGSGSGPRPTNRDAAAALGRQMRDELRNEIDHEGQE